MCTGADTVVEGAILQRFRCVERAVGSDLSVLNGGRLVGLPARLSSADG